MDVQHIAIVQLKKHIGPAQLVMHQTENRLPSTSQVPFTLQHKLEVFGFLVGHYKELVDQLQLGGPQHLQTRYIMDVFLF